MKSETRHRRSAPVSRARVKTFVRLIGGLVRCALTTANAEPMHIVRSGTGHASSALFKTRRRKGVCHADYSDRPLGWRSDPSAWRRVHLVLRQVAHRRVTPLCEIRARRSPPARGSALRGSGLSLLSSRAWARGTLLGREGLSELNSGPEICVPWAWSSFSVRTRIEISQRGSKPTRRTSFDCRTLSREADALSAGTCMRGGRNRRFMSNHSGRREEPAANSDRGCDCVGGLRTDIQSSDAWRLSIAASN